MAYVDFSAAKSAYSLEEVCSWYGVTLKKDGASTLRCSCPICKGEGDRAFVVTPAKQMWHCFSKCQKGGDSIAFVAAMEQVPVKEAAQKILDHKESPRPTQAKELQVLDYLQHDHEKVAALGITPDQAKRLGIGYAPKGTLVGRVCLEQRDSTGKLICYIGIGLHLDPVVKVPKNV